MGQFNIAGNASHIHILSSTTVSLWDSLNILCNESHNVFNICEFLDSSTYQKVKHLPTYCLQQLGEFIAEFKILGKELSFVFNNCEFLGQFKIPGKESPIVFNNCVHGTFKHNTYLHRLPMAG
jgi:hypothetical protein